MEETTYHDLNSEQQELLDAAEEAMSHSYSPYSKYAVGAAVRCEDGTVIKGTNVENASSNVGVCAERVAVSRAVAQGKRVFHTVAIISKPENGPSSLATGPCGTCRQFLNEFAELAGTDIELILSDTDKETIKISSIKEMLPESFGPKNMNLDIS